MKKLILAAALLLAAGPVLAAPPAPRQTVTGPDGMTYSFTVTQTMAGRRIVGDDSRGMRFDLNVSGAQVSGVYGLQTVSFRVPEKSGDAARIAGR